MGCVNKMFFEDFVGNCLFLRLFNLDELGILIWKILIEFKVMFVFV